MNILRRLTLSTTRQSGWKVAVIFGFSVLLVLGLLLARAHTASAASGATITSDKQDYAPGATVTLTGAGWDSGEAVHIFVNDAVGNTWSLNSNPDPVADANGGFTYSFSLPSDFIANYTATATGPTSGTATTTFTDSDAACPDLSGKVASNLVGASFTTSGSTATYTFSSFKDLSPSGGVPGLIKYCVYPANSDLPTSITPQAVGANGVAWGDTSKSDNFSFNRPGGNPTDIPLDGKTTTMGTATWSGSVPTSQTILLHINDATECKSLYGVTEDTCFVLPGSPQQQQASDLTVSKTDTPSFTRTFSWGITKDVDKTLVEQIGGGTATFNYTVNVTHDSGTDGGWQVTGTITVNNPNGFDVAGVNVTDDGVNNGGNCSVTNGTGLTVPANGSVDVSYNCTYSSAPNPSNGTNKATATWDGTKYNTPDSSASGTAAFDFGSVSPTLVDNSVTVSDTLGGALGTVTSADSSPKTFTYSNTVNVPTFNCVFYNNTAKFTTNTTNTTGSASQKVEVCGPAKTGALTMGFWQNKNGQGIISGASQSALGTWLRQYNPFSDAPSTGLATYVANVIKTANCSGTTCNSMLRAQMLATALDVYFSDPGRGGNKINAPAPIGGVKIDLTMICHMIDGSGGTATCSGTFENVSSAFNNQSSMTVLDMLSWAASQSDAGGVHWYGNVKATQVLAKDAFDAINNQVAFAP